MAQLTRTRTKMVLSSFCNKMAFVMLETNIGSSLKEGNNINTPNALQAAALTLASVSETRENSSVTANR
jgi:hypothetical protein